MRLALSSAAAPRLPLPELLAGCARRGLEALELVEGHAHGIVPGGDEAQVRRALELAAEQGVSIVAYRTAGDDAGDPRAARLSQLLGAPVVAPPGAFNAAQAWAAVKLYAHQGGQLLLGHGSDPEEVAALREIVAGAGGAAALAWDLVPSAEGVPPGTILDAAGAQLAHIRLYGGGPEAAAQAGLGIGELSFRLATAGWSGALALAPSTPRYLTAWNFWLGRRGWGCGSTNEEKQLALRAGEKE